MAHFDRIGEIGLDQLLAKRLITPGGSVAPTVAPEIFPSLTLENDRPEWSFLKGEIRCASQVASVAAVAGQRSRVRFVNPANSRSIAVITRIRATASQSLALRRMQTLPPNLGTLANTVSVDTRVALQLFTSRMTLSFGAEVGAPPGSVAFANWPSTDTLDYDQPIILSPNSAIDVECLTDNTAVGPVWFSWYERGLNPGELL